MSQNYPEFQDCLTVMSTNRFVLNGLIARERVETKTLKFLLEKNNVLK